LRGCAKGSACVGSFARWDLACFAINDYEYGNKNKDENESRWLLAMNILTVNAISKLAGDKLLFENIGLGINEGQKIALIGVNGSGKTTLLNILALREEPDSGDIARRSGLRIAKLDQLPAFCPDHTIAEHLLAADLPMVQLVRRYQRACGKVQQSDDAQSRRELEEVTAAMDREDAWTLEHAYESLLAELGIGSAEPQMRALSGGMLKKVALAQLFLSESDLLLLDEPTNHLDIDTIEWLQNRLQKTTASIVMVTHDRYILDSVCGQIIELDRRRLYRYSGNYRYYLQKKAEIENSLAMEERRVRSILRRELVWLGQTPQARETKQKARIERVHAMMDQMKSAPRPSLEMSVSGRRLGKKILEAHGIAKKYGDAAVINKYTRIFKRKERIGVVGPNGSGKTTLLNLLTGRIEPDAGFVDRGINTVFGVFDQTSADLSPSMTVLETVREVAEVITLPNGKTISAGQLLDRFLFPSKLCYCRCLCGIYRPGVEVRFPNFAAVGSLFDA